MMARWFIYLSLADQPTITHSYNEITYRNYKLLGCIKTKMFVLMHPKQITKS